MKEYLNQFSIDHFVGDLLNWFDAYKRDLPWRRDPKPYHVWISEIMLQQTQVNTVIPYYENFLRRFPTIKELAEAEEEQVLKAWEGLGYYSRARNIHHTAKTIIEEFDGHFPQNYEDVIKLKGIGSYTAGAILSMAFGQKQTAVDGNVMRVMSRVLLSYEDIAKEKTKKGFEAIMEEVVPVDRPGAFNQSLMDLGATICTPKSPRCFSCPVQKHCRAYKEGVPSLLPVKTSKTKQKVIPLVTGVIEDKEGRYLLRKRPSEGLLANMWEFVQLEATTVEDFQESLHYTYDLKVDEGISLGEIKHVFSHLIWIMNLYLFKNVKIKKIPEDFQWMTLDEIQQVPISTAHKKVFEQLVNLS